MARIIVTGATGFLGGHLVRHLHNQGHDVIGLGRSLSSLTLLKTAGIQTLKIDLAKGLQLCTADMTGPADALVHCAALSSPWGPEKAFVDANVKGTETAINLAKTVGVRRFINISSPSVYYSNRDQVNVNETLPLPQPINAYADTKAEAENLVLSATDIGPINLRPRGIYGTGDSALLPRLLSAARQGPLPLLRGGIAEIDLTHVSDVVAAIEATLTANTTIEGETFNISGGQARRVADIVNKVCLGVGFPVQWRTLPWRAVMAAARLSEIFYQLNALDTEPRLTRYKVGLFAFRQSLDISKAQKLLGWSPKVDFDEGLELTFKNMASG